MRTTPDASQAFESLESRTLLAADLALSLGAITTSQPGTSKEVLHVPTTLSNIGNADYASGGVIHYFLSTDQTLDASDLSWTTMAIPNLAAGATSNLSLSAARPLRLVATATAPAVPAGAYFVIATLEFPAGVSDENAANNTAASPGTIAVDYHFGNVNGSRVTLNAFQGNDRFATFQLNGPGTGNVVNNAGQLMVTVDGSTASTSLFVHGNSAVSPVLNGITINGPAQQIGLDHTNVSGNITVNGSLKQLSAVDLSNGTVLITQAGSGTDIRARNLSDETINSAGAIKTLQMTSWSAGSAAVRDAIIAPSLVHLLVYGNFGADLSINHTGRGEALTSAEVLGVITGGTWTITGKVGTIIANGIASGWTANINGNLDHLVVHGQASGHLAAQNIQSLDFNGNVNGMTVLAGANLGSDGAIGGTGAAADTFSGATIGTISVKGNLTNSTFAAGVNPGNGVFGDADDVFLFPSSIGRVRVLGTTTNSQVLASSINGINRHQDEDEDENGNGNDNENENEQHNGSSMAMSSNGFFVRFVSTGSAIRVGIDGMFGR
jgi:hypothetical protein